MQPDLGKFVLEHLKEHGKQMVNSPTTVSFVNIDSSVHTYSCLPRMGARPLICVPRAARTCWEVSETRSSMLGIMSLSRTDRSTRPQKPGIWPAIAVLTSASLSFSSLTNAGTKSLDTTSSSTALAICKMSAQASCTMFTHHSPFRTYRQSCNEPSSSCPLSNYAATSKARRGWTVAWRARPRQ